MARRVVWKYEVPDGEGSFGLDVPDGWEFAHLGVQGNEPFLWLLVDPEREIRRCRVFARDTGQPLDEADLPDGLTFLDLFFVGTYETRFLAIDGVSVRHVWMEGTSG